jgi:hypothetical protein
VKVEIQDPARWNWTGRSMTALQPVLSVICRHYRLYALSLSQEIIPYAFQNMLLFHSLYKPAGYMHQQFYRLRNVHSALAIFM